MRGQLRAGWSRIHALAARVGQREHDKTGKYHAYDSRRILTRRVGERGASAGMNKPPDEITDEIAAAASTLLLRTGLFNLSTGWHPPRLMLSA
jgi:hypothetical protein